MNEPQRMDRREAIKWMLAATATVSLLNFRSFGASVPAVTGYGTDPDLMKFYKPGDLWPLTFSEEQHRAVAALCDVIIPADDKSPGASSLGVPDFIDEWISAPYPGPTKRPGGNFERPGLARPGIQKTIWKRICRPE